MNTHQHNAENDTPRPCLWWHRWNSIEAAEWVGGMALPVLRHTCRRCGATRLRRYGA